MNRIFCIFFLLCHLTYNGQSILLEYNSTGAGRNVGAFWEKGFGKNTLGAGLGCSINRIEHPDDQNKIYHKRLYATKVVNYLNLHLSYDRTIFNEISPAFKPFFFIDVQAKYSGTRNRLILPYSIDSTDVSATFEESILYKQYIEFFGPFFWLEPTIGIGFRTSISDRLYLKQQLGMGVLLTLGKDDQLAYRMFSRYDWEFASLINVSLGWRLTKKK